MQPLQLQAQLMQPQQISAQLMQSSLPGLQMLQVPGLMSNNCFVLNNMGRQVQQMPMNPADVQNYTMTNQGIAPMMLDGAMGVSYGFN